MEKKRLSVEEEFLNYGETNSNGYGNGGAQQSAKAANGNSFSKLIQILIILVLLAVLVVLGIIGYMYAKKAFMVQNQQQSTPQKVVEHKVASAPITKPQLMQQKPPAQKVQKEEMHAKEPQEVAVVQKEQKETQVTKEQVQEHVTLQEQKPHTLATQAKKEEVQEAQEVANTAQTASNTKPQVAQEEPAKQQPSAKKDLKTMSDEELIEYLKSLKPDQLKNLDIEKLILSRKAEKGEQNVQVAKTEYLNNQLVLTQKPQEAKKSETAQLSKKLSSLIEQETPKSSYVQKLQKEIATRQKSIRYYVVQPGDTLSKIAKEIYGSVKAYVKIYEANQDIIKDPNLIFPGQKLRIPSI